MLYWTLYFISYSRKRYNLLVYSFRNTTLPFSSDVLNTICYTIVYMLLCTLHCISYSTLSCIIYWTLYCTIYCTQTPQWLAKLDSSLRKIKLHPYLMYIVLKSVKNTVLWVVVHMLLYPRLGSSNKIILGAINSAV